MNKLLKKILVLAGVLVLVLSLAAPAFADSSADGAEPAVQAEVQEDNSIGLKAVAAGLGAGNRPGPCRHPRPGRYRSR